MRVAETELFHGFLTGILGLLVLLSWQYREETSGLVQAPQEERNGLYLIELRLKRKYNSMKLYRLASYTISNEDRKFAAESTPPL